jgi:hypothetical protein
LPFVMGTINAEKYIQILTDLGIFEELYRLHGAFNWIFQQEGALCHTSQMAVDWIEENCDLLSGWPANSPDFNPIELLWAILKHSVADLEPTTIAELKKVLLWVWDIIPIVTINSLCSSFEARLHLCLEVQGRSISKLLGPCVQSHACQGWKAGLLQSLGLWTATEDRIIYLEYHRIASKWQKMMHSLYRCIHGGSRFTETRTTCF